ncbi:TSUP family transporter [Georgenia deserti]|uniref:Probable membrane transporter protein n=1 Tax=Georgenia deserti TaxID=2093781 RepID=A0ABW4L6W9_9MICO
MALSPVDLALVAAAVLLGAGTQRVTGLGFGLVSAPFLVLLLGPFHGVVLANALGLFTSVTVLVQVWRRVDLRRFALLAVPAAVAIAPGAWLALTVSGPVLSVVVGSVAFLAILAVVSSERMRVFRGRGGGVAAGGLSGFMNVTAGVGGPAITLYALSTAWEHRSFVATAQLYFAVVSGASLLAKGWPVLAPTAWAVVLGGLVVGVVAGTALSWRIPASRAQKLVAALALAGSLATVAKGVVAVAA